MPHGTTRVERLARSRYFETMVSIPRFIVTELTTLVAPDDVVLARCSAERMPLAVSAIGGTETPAASPLGGDVDGLRRAVRLRRAMAAYYVFFCVVLPAVPLVLGVARALVAPPDDETATMAGAVFAGAVFSVVGAIVGLVVAAKLAPLFFRLLGVKVQAPAPSPAAGTTTESTPAPEPQRPRAALRSIALWLVLMLISMAVWQVFNAPAHHP